jgi:hypothetical protein
MRDDQLLSQVLLIANNEDDIETLPQSSVERIMQLQMKQMQFMQSLTKQFSYITISLAMSYFLLIGSL